MEGDGSFCDFCEVKLTEENVPEWKDAVEDFEEWDAILCKKCHEANKVNGR
jgi:ferredoxin